MDGTRSAASEARGSDWPPIGFFHIDIAELYMLVASNWPAGATVAQGAGA
jgi:hypothetical protein